MMDGNSSQTTPPPLPPRKPSEMGSTPTTPAKTPPPLPPRHAAADLAPVITSPAGEVSMVDQSQRISGIEEKGQGTEDGAPGSAITVEVTPASPTSMDPREDETTASPKQHADDANEHEVSTGPTSAPLPAPDGTPLARDIAKSSNPPASAPPNLARPPLPPRPSTVPSPFPIDANPHSAPGLGLPMPWILGTAALMILAYTRMLPLWILVGGIGAAMYFLRAQPVHEQEFQSTPLAPIPSNLESRVAVDWVNHALYALFPLISTDVLTPFIDLLEDALIQQVPPIVTSVRLTSPSLGSVPVLLTSLRAMSDQEWFESISAAGPSRRGEVGSSDAKVTTKSKAALDKAAETIKHHRDGSKASLDLDRSGSRSRSGSSASPSDGETMKLESERRRKRDIVLQRINRRRRRRMQEKRGVKPEGDEVEGEHRAEDEEELEEADEHDPNVGHYVNYQVGFEYTRKETHARGWGLHMLAYFGWGVKGLGTSEIPVYIDLLGMKGQLNVRLLLSATPPFAKTATFSFSKIPDFDISAKPLTRSTFNAMEIPGMKTYVRASIAEVAKIFVRPESYSLDIDRLLLGREAALRTQAVGVLHIVIHRAKDLPKTDTMGSCDPYVAISMSKFNKPLFSTRTMIDNPNPSWEEPAFILVATDAIASGERLRVRVVDSDRFSADDAMGVVEVEMSDLVDQSFRSLTSISNRRIDNLTADRPGMKTSGTLEWSVKFCPIWQMGAEEMERRVREIRAKREAEMPPPGSTWWLDMLRSWCEGPPDWEAKRRGDRKETLAWFTGEKERDEMEAAEKPSAQLQNGVLQFHIHQCTELELESLGGTFSTAKNRGNASAGGKPALADVVDRTPAENPDPPSAYCEVIINDRLVYRTRTKQLTPLPYFNALSERFIRDWRLAKVVFVLRDERDREHDPILGLVSINLRDVFKDGSQSTRWYPIVGGLGWGRIRISLLWKPIEISLPPRVSGFDVCTLQISSLAATDLSGASEKGLMVMLETETDRYTLSGQSSATGSRSSLDSPRRSSVSAATVPSLEDAPEVEWEITKPIKLAVMYRHSCSLIISFASSRGVLKKRKVIGIALVRLANVPDEEETDVTVPIFATSSVKEALKGAQAYERNDNTEIKAVGLVNLGFKLRPGVSRAHRKVCKRDLRFKHVYEAWEAAKEVDTHLDNIAWGDEMRWRKEKILSGEESDDSSGSESGDDAPEDGKREVGDVDSPARPRALSTSKREPKGGKDGDEDSNTEDELFGKWRAHSHALHKQNKGIFQLKVARTGRFVKDKIQAKLLSRADSKTQRQRGADLEVEKEGQSSL